MRVQSFAGITGITGVGMTELSRASGTDVATLAVQACRAAIADAELTGDDIDAVLTYHLNDSCPVNHVAARVGAPDGIWTNEIYGGGTQSASVLGDAAMLIASGTATNVLIFRALNGRSGKRMNSAALPMPGGEAQFTIPYGMAGPVNLFALSATRWMHQTGATCDDLAAVVIQSRTLALDNPRALVSHPLTRAEYDASPMIATPLRRVDCCQETDGAAAVVLSKSTSSEHARTSPRVRTVLRGGGPGASTMDKAADPSTLFSHYLGDRLWAVSGMTPADVDLAMIYDAYSPIVLQQLEDLGFCGRGESGDLVREGHTLPTGRIPVNPSGGLLSEGYVHGLNNVIEAVRQLRGSSSAQTHDPAVALCTGFGGSYGSALVLERA